MLLPKGPTNLAFMLRRNQAAKAINIHFKSLELEIDLDDLAGDLDLATRQKIEIARALYRNPKVLLLDEPTSSLTGDDVDWLGRVITKATGRGVTILFISHRMSKFVRFVVL